MREIRIERILIAGSHGRTIGAGTHESVVNIRLTIGGRDAVAGIVVLVDRNSREINFESGGGM